MFFSCPWCNGLIEIPKDAFNCNILRHGTWLDGKQIDPHLIKVECDKKDLIRGCGKPIQISMSDPHTLIKCDYI